MNAEALVKYSIENLFVGTWFHYTGKKYNTLTQVYCNVNLLVRVSYKVHECWLLTNNGNSTLFHKYGYWYKNLLVYRKQWSGRMHSSLAYLSNLTAHICWLFSKVVSLLPNSKLSVFTSYNPITDFISMFHDNHFTIKSYGNPLTCILFWP